MCTLERECTESGVTVVAFLSFVGYLGVLYFAFVFIERKQNLANSPSFLACFRPRIHRWFCFLAKFLALWLSNGGRCRNVAVVAAVAAAAAAAAAAAVSGCCCRCCCCCCCCWLLLQLLVLLLLLLLLVAGCCCRCCYFFLGFVFGCRACFPIFRFLASLSGIPSARRVCFRIFAAGRACSRIRFSLSRLFSRRACFRIFVVLVGVVVASVFRFVHHCRACFRIFPGLWSLSSVFS